MIKEMGAVSKCFEDINTARQAILAETKGQRGISGGMLCPVCKVGHLSYTVQHSNGHIWGACTSEGCVSWME